MSPGLLLNTLLALVLAQDPTDTVKKLIADLDAETVEQRDEAAMRLKAIGRPARAALEAAARDGSPELRGRARAILNDLYSTWAAETYQSIEAAALAAKTLQVKFTSQSRHNDDSGVERQRSIRGTFLLKEGDRVRMEFAYEAAGGPQQLILTSDGRTIGPHEGEVPMEAPRDFRANVTKELVQGCALTWFDQVYFFRRDGSTFKDHRPRTFPPDPPTEPDAAGVRSIRYTVTLPAPAKPHEVTLFFDAKTLRLVKRIFTSDNLRVRSVTTETYDEYVLDADIPDARFTR